MTKAFAYLRVSGKGQVNGDGFPRQLKAINAYAATHSTKIVRVFREEGVPGAKESMDRPAWAEMMTALHSNGVRTIIIEKLDRLARDLMIQEATIADLKKHGFTLISVAEPDLMANDPTRVAFRQMMGVFAQYDKSQIVLKLRGARMRKKAMEGRCEGRKPFGYYQGEAVALERMEALQTEGLGFDRIAERLNAEGIPTRTGRRWHGVVVNRILTAKRRAGGQRPARPVQRPDECPYEDGDITIDLTKGPDAFSRDILRADPRDPRFSAAGGQRIDILLGPVKPPKRKR